MRLTGHVPGQALGQGVVEVPRLALQHSQDIPLAHKDDENPNSLKNKENKNKENNENKDDEHPNSLPI